jgi:multidrug resistance efflux pump
LESSTAQESPADVKVAPPDSQRPRDPVRTTTYAVLVVLALLFVWYILADRHAPWTDQARVQGFVVPITPKVSGKVIAVNVVQDQVVEAKELLAQIDPREYELAVRRAESNLELAGQETGADTAAVRAAEADLAEARAQLLRTRQDLERIESIYEQDPGAVSASGRDEAQAAVATAEAQEASAIAELEQAEERLGKGGEENAKVKDAAAALEQARIDLADTKLYAPSDGGVTNLKIDEGQYAKEGSPLMTFTSFTDVWVKAYLRENSIENLKIGDSVELALDAAPGRVFSGEIASVGFAVQQPSGGEVGELESVKGDSGWLRDAQRFPVIIHFTEGAATGYRRMGGQVDVQIYTGDRPILNALGWLWIRLMSLMSYVY